MEYLQEAEYMSDYEKSLIKEYNKNLKLIEENIGTLMLSIESRNDDIMSELNELDTFDDDIFIGMTEFDKDSSGLSLSMWIDNGTMNNHHIPRLKVQDPDDKHSYLSISISKDPKIIAGKFKNDKTNPLDIYEFIMDHYDELISIWNGEMSGIDFVSKYSKEDSL